MSKRRRRRGVQGALAEEERLGWWLAGIGALVVGALVWMNRTKVGS